MGIESTYSILVGQKSGLNIIHFFAQVESILNELLRISDRISKNYQGTSLLHLRIK